MTASNLRTPLDQKIPDRLPCHFCSSTDCGGNHEYSGGGHFFISCANCGARGANGGTFVEAVKLWNNRAASIENEYKP